MSSNTEKRGRQGKGQRSWQEALLWAIVIILLMTAILGNYIYRDVTLPLRTLMVIILISLSAAVASFTNKGKEAINFAYDSKIEIRKVMWPTLQETLHTTLMVAIITAVMSLILWGLDGIFVRLISFIISLRF